MSFVRSRARILERSITPGNGPYALAGAVRDDYNSFASFMSVGDVTEATVVEPGVAFWTGLVTYSAANEITLTTVEETKGSFGSGTKEIFTSPLASRALLREDISGAILTGGTSTAYTVASYRKYDTLAELDGNIVAFTPHMTNGAVVTLNVDGRGAKPLRAAPNTELMPNVLIQGTPYLALYNNTDQAFYLHGFFGNPYDVPLATGMDYWAATTPNSAFAFPTGQAISRSIYATLFALIGTTYGSGDGSTTFNLPDKTERVSVMKSNGAGRLSPTYFGANSGTLGATGGAERTSIDQANFPNVNFGITQNPHSHLYAGGTTGGTGNAASAGGPGFLEGPFNPVGTGNTFNTSSETIGILVNSGGSGTPIRTVQPTIVCNYIMRII